MKHLNLFIFLFLSTFFLIFSSQIKFSSHFLEVFFSQKSMDLIAVTQKLNLSNSVYIATKGFDEKALKRLKYFQTSLDKMEGISQTTLSLAPTKEERDYYQKNYYLLSEFNQTQWTHERMHAKLQEAYDTLKSAFIYTPLNVYDPLELFVFPHKNASKHLKLEGYGYVLKATTSIDTSSAKEAKILYDALDTLFKNEKKLMVYAPFFFLVENSTYIREDTQKIMLFASFLLLFLYFVMLKNHRLVFHTLLAIGSSVLSAILFSAWAFGEVNLLILAFGISLSSISVDYLFHYYFHGSFLQKKPIWEKKVFFGFLTSFGVFVIFTFIEIKLFYQLAFFAAVSLLCSYLIFTFIFPYLSFDVPDNEKKQRHASLAKRKPLRIVVLFIFSILLLAYSSQTLEFDDDLRNLDYKNVSLLKLSKTFREGLMQSNYQTLLLSASSKEALLEHVESLTLIYPQMLSIGKWLKSQKACQKRVKEIQMYHFDLLKKSIENSASSIGFRENVFANAYPNIEKMSCTNLSEESVKNFKMVKLHQRYYTVAYLSKSIKVEEGRGIEILNITAQLSKDMQNAKQSILKFIKISIGFILIMLFIVSGIHILYPLVYILFPLSIVLVTLSFLGKVNIMHLFSMIIMLAMTIDYGVYMYNTKTYYETRRAISYALLSTFAGFGVLIFSHTQALHSIGLVITIGIGSIFLLLYGRKNENI
jgi:predicted RND superfamily exporter protein